MNTDTPYFRSSLSIAAIWMVAWGFIGYQSYHDGYRELSLVGIPSVLDGTEFDTSDSPTAHCYDARMDFRDDGSDRMFMRAPTQQESSECYDDVLQMERQFARDDNSRLLNKSWQDFFLIGVTPALTLLLVVAFWANLSGSGIAIGKRYVDWLRHGANQPKE